MKYIGFLSLVFFLFSCKSATESNALCDCVEAGKKADSISASFFNREHTQEGKDSLQLALQQRDEICKEFQEMDALRLQELAKDCKVLKLEEEK